MGPISFLARTLRRQRAPRRVVPAGRRAFSRPVATWVDANYGPATCVMLTSLYLNNPANEFDTYIFTAADQTGVAQPPFTEAFEKLRRDHQRVIHVLSYDDIALKGLRMSNLPQMNYLNRATYGKLLLADLLEVEDFLYLDSDLIVQEDIAPLLEMEIGAHIVAGAADSQSLVDWGARLGLAETDSYINSGVMIVNAALWRREHISEALWAWYARNGGELGYLDQDVLNAALVGRKLILDGKWNTMQHDLLGAGTLKDFDGAAFRGCFHFTYVPKPWAEDAPASTRHFYRHYADQAPLSL